jgi:hypothetical protein
MDENAGITRARLSQDFLATIEVGSGKEVSRPVAKIFHGPGRSPARRRDEQRPPVPWPVTVLAHGSPELTIFATTASELRRSKPFGKNG